MNWKNHQLTWAAVIIVAGTGGLVACQSSGSTSRTNSNASMNNSVDEAALSAIASENRFDRARRLLLAELDSTSPVVRANALESLHALPADAADGARRLLMDENRGVRFVAAMTIGKLQVKEVAHLLRPLVEDSSESVRIAARYALSRCGEPVELTPIGMALQSRDAEVRANAALVLGELGNPSAIPMIRQVAGSGSEIARPAVARIVDLQLAEALAKLGDESQRHTIRAALFAAEDQQELAAMAAVMCGRLKDYEGIGSLKRLISADGLERRPAEVRMAAAMALAMMGEQVPPEVALEYISSPRPEIRTQVALTLGEMGYQRGMFGLEELMEDSNPLVRVAAARSIVQIHRGIR